MASIPGGAIVSGSGAIGGAGIFQNPDYGQSRDGSVTLGRDPMNRSKRYSRYGDALKAAAAYKEKAKAEKEAEIEMGDEDDDKGTRGFKISPDATVVEGYRSPPFKVDAPQGGGILGPLGAGLSTFFPVTGRIVSSIGGLTGY
jgi:hypothetical protein